jgi:hypothetical protein
MTGRCADTDDGRDPGGRIDEHEDVTQSIPRAGSEGVYRHEPRRLLNG